MRELPAQRAKLAPVHDTAVDALERRASCCGEMATDSGGGNSAPEPATGRILCRRRGVIPVWEQRQGVPAPWVVLRRETPRGLLQNLRTPVD